MRGPSPVVECRTMRYPVAGKVVLLTGATGGIGGAMARALGARGANLVLTGRRAGVLRGLAAELGGDRTLAMTVDVTDRQALDAVVRAATDRFGGLDVVIANAGVLIERPTTIAAAADQEFERVIEVDLLGAWRTVRSALPQIIARRGHVVLTASIFAYCNGVVNAAYAVSKAGVEQLGRALRAELAPHGATAGVLYPGWTDTPLIKPAFGGVPAATEMLRHAYPKALRTPIAPERVAAATIRGIERRSARIIVPARWIPISLLRGIVNAVTDPVLDRDPTIKRLILDLEQSAEAPRADLC
ncbi:MAG TPA: short-chain dehydrogenase/reductase [Solirubrobacteraceae bacterium]|nr:short-chain dehydrogenase/reductase [Solirubrobacteraceae bacterium]